MTHQSGFFLQAKRLNRPEPAAQRLVAQAQTEPTARAAGKGPANIVETDD